MSAKLRMTLWCTLMVLLLSAMVFTFILIINANSTVDDPAGRLVKVVNRNASKLEFDRGRFEWEEVDAFKRGVYSCFYTEEGAALMGAEPEGFSADILPFEANEIRSTYLNGKEYYVYDMFVNMEVTRLWVRGLISAEDSSGLMHTLLILTFTLLPAILILTVFGSWIIARSSFKPMENIIKTANEISDGADLSLRLNLKKGPTEFRRLADSFDRMFGHLENSFEAERQFSSDASHELRTPITIILAQCDRARRKDMTREDFIRSVNVIEEQGKHMSELVQQLLGLTRLQHGTDRYPLRQGNLSELVRSCCEEFVPADSRNISFKTEIEEGVTASFNPSLISRVVHNLLQNAYKYGKDGGKVSLKLRRDAQGAVLCVTDDGIGIAPEDKDKVWKRFWQADSSRGDEGSSGLGLSMVAEIAKLHNGRVDVESEIGQGSRFMFILP